MVNHRFTHHKESLRPLNSIGDLAPLLVVAFSIAFMMLTSGYGIKTVDNIPPGLPTPVRALARFLLRRALLNPEILGHVLFWYLKAEMHVPGVRARYGAMLEQYLRNCGSHRLQLGHQMFVMNRLTRATPT